MLRCVFGIQAAEEIPGLSGQLCAGVSGRAGALTMPNRRGQRRPLWTMQFRDRVRAIKTEAPLWQLDCLERMLLLRVGGIGDGGGSVWSRQHPHQPRPGGGCGARPLARVSFASMVPYTNVSITPASLHNCSILSKRWNKHYP